MEHMERVESMAIALTGAVEQLLLHSGAALQSKDLPLLSSQLLLWRLLDNDNDSQVTNINQLSSRQNRS